VKICISLLITGSLFQGSVRIDLVRHKQRGLAMGLNASAGYLAVAAMAFTSGWLATAYGLRYFPFYLAPGR
jgi:predicted MFS family arabinose efflux permease